MIRILAAVFISVSLSGAEIPKGFAPVPKDKLDNLRLLLTDAGCSLAAPNADWVWLAPVNSDGRNYMCFSTKSGGSVSISIGEMKNNEMDDHTREELTKGAKQAAIKSGSAVSNEKFEKSEIPLPGKSWRFSYEMKADLRRAFVIFYFVQTVGKSFVTMQGISMEATDTPTFHNFVASLQLLKPAPKDK